MRHLIFFLLTITLLTTSVSAKGDADTCPADYRSKLPHNLTRLFPNHLAVESFADFGVTGDNEKVIAVILTPDWWFSPSNCRTFSNNDATLERTLSVWRLTKQGWKPIAQNSKIVWSLDKYAPNEVGIYGQKGLLILRQGFMKTRYSGSDDYYFRMVPRTNNLRLVRRQFSYTTHAYAGISMGQEEIERFERDSKITDLEGRWALLDYLSGGGGKIEYIPGQRPQFFHLSVPNFPIYYLDKLEPFDPLPKISIVTAPWGPSFECGLATQLIELQICMSKELAEADVSLAQVYKDKLERAPDKDKAALKSEQTIWEWNQRDQCFDEPCILDAYSSRIQQLSR